MQATVKVLFVLRDDKITRWIPKGDDLTVETVSGLESAPYTGADFWREWRDENQLVDGDVVDALLLSDRVDGFGDLPDWLKNNGDSTWSVGDLVKLAEKPQFVNTSLLLVRGKERIRLQNGDGALKLMLSIMSTLSYCFPSQGDIDALQREKSAGLPPEELGEKPTLMADFLVDEKSRLIGPDTLIAGTVKAFSQFRGCFIDTAASGDQMRIRPQEYEKIEGLKEKLKITGAELSFRVKSVSDNEGLIEVELELVD